MANLTSNLTALQLHVAFWDTNADSIITPYEIYTGFRALGFSILLYVLTLLFALSPIHHPPPYILALLPPKPRPLSSPTQAPNTPPLSTISASQIHEPKANPHHSSFGGLLIPFFFSYPTTLGHSYLPDPLFRIYTSSIHKAKHGSDSGVYTPEGHIRESLFGEMLGLLDSSQGTDLSSSPTVSMRGEGFVGQRTSYRDGKEGGESEERTTNTTRSEQRQKSLGITDLLNLHARNRVAADPAGWSFAAMEWWTTWLLLQENGRVWEDDLRAVYDGSLFFRIREARMRGGEGGGEGGMKTRVGTEGERMDEGLRLDEEEQGWDRNKGYGWRDWMRGMWRFGNWRVWELEGLRADGGLKGRDLSKGAGMDGNVSHGEL